MNFRSAGFWLCILWFSISGAQAQQYGVGQRSPSAESMATGKDALSALSALPRTAPADLATTGTSLRDPDMTWVNDTLASMTLDEKIGQMLFSSEPSVGASDITQYHVGGFCFLGNNQLAGNIVNTVNQLQNASPFPLWFAIDAEAGLGARLADATRFPLNMGMGAANDPALSEMEGRITAQECRAIGIQIAFAPVVDVNTEPANPIISTRSYGDRPDLVTRMARAYLTGAHAEGLLCTCKHYPGHGATTSDSHSSLPTVDLPLSTLEAVHIKPYHDLAGEGLIDFVMSAHVWYSAVDNDYGKPWPATLSPRFLTQILRNEIGYTNLVISDSYSMQGLAIAVPDPEERAVLGIQAGLDIILGPSSDIGYAFQGIQNAVSNGDITESRIDASVRRILIAKSEVGLPENRTVDPTHYQQVLETPDHLAVVRQACEEAFTCAKYDLPTTVPVPLDSHVLLLTFAASNSIFYVESSTNFTTPFSQRVPNTDVMHVSSRPGSTEQQTVLNAVPGHDVVIVADYSWTTLGSRQVTLINELTGLGVPVILVDFGAPYHYTSVPGVDAFYCGYSSTIAMQQVAAEVLTGERRAAGELPVTVPGLPVPITSVGWFVK